LGFLITDAGDNLNLRGLRLDIGSLNVNSFNVSTLGMRSSKTFIKIEAITHRKHDIILLSDCRLGKCESDVSRMMGLNRNCSYKVYFNSTKDSRGVGIAIKRNIFHEIVDIYRSADENVILCKVKIKNVLLVIGSIYGPNENNPDFFVRLRRKLEDWALPFIIGGDFNTVLDQSLGMENLDREGGGGRPPNPRNSTIIRSWIE
jgi:hypothetical protein